MTTERFNPELKTSKTNLVNKLPSNLIRFGIGGFLDSYDKEKFARTCKYMTNFPEFKQARLFNQCGLKRCTHEVIHGAAVHSSDVPTLQQLRKKLEAEYEEFANKLLDLQPAKKGR